MRFTGIVSTVFTAGAALAFSHDAQHRLNDKINVAGTAEANPKCHLPAPLNPSDDGLESSHDLFSSKKALQLMVKKHQSLVRIPSICYDDMGDLDTDDRWKPFNDIPKMLKKAYPTVHKHITPEKVNKFGLVYTLKGSDPSLQPILLAGHQDVVPVAAGTLHEWVHPPFDAFYNETDGYLWGRGASDDKSAITAQMSALEALLSQKTYKPRRTVILAFGFDEECSGHRGAGHISKHLEKRYGEHGIAAILDEGGAGLQKMGDVLYALPAVYEKGYLDIWFNVSVVGGHSSVPTPHTAIGIMAEIVTTLEHNPFKPEIAKNGAIHQCLACFAEHSPHVFPDLTKLVNGGDLQGVAKFLTKLSRDMQYMVQTSQAIDVISGGQKINALPEFVTLGVNHRYAPQDSIGSIQHRIVGLIKDIAESHKLRVEAFEDDADYDEYLAANNLSRQCNKDEDLWQQNHKGTLTIAAKKKSYITPQSPTTGPVWDIFVGTVRHSFAQEAKTVVAAPGAMTGNTDTRHYLNLSKNIYRWSPGSLKSFSNIHGVNERLLMSEQMNMAKFYYDFIRNFDKANV
ncbi:CPS1-Gly-X carboxypeptidase YSCS precursor [Fusarium pseudocircinatum]|uniref:CPS1-Gly-X carboxypeptidase YSCS n=1 Tax=Fusarium pseudocircinatum TaxID=56676 RepID=A0A8H5UTS8_9HYPO|nr:CPS1-Gly-X carboxypeptidase YSCS precursor [Fusarium pseudocircinatum]